MDTYDESWIAKNWRPTAALVYLLICMLDFFIMPIYYEIHNYNYLPEKLLVLAAPLKDGPTQIEAIRILLDQKAWNPITLKESGLLHLAFGAILGVTAWGRSQERIVKAQTKNGHGIVPDSPDGN